MAAPFLPSYSEAGGRPGAALGGTVGSVKSAKGYGTRPGPAARPPPRGLPRDLAPLSEDALRSTQSNAGRGVSDVPSLRSGGRQGLRVAGGVRRRMEQQPSLEEQLHTAQKLLHELWEELNVSPEERKRFAAAAPVGVSGEHLRSVTDEIQRLTDRLGAAAAVERAVEVREGCLCVLHEFLRKAPPPEQWGPDHAAAAQSLLNSLRLASLDVVDCILYWRSCCGDFTALYRWRGESYLLKMLQDLTPLQTPRLEKALKCNVASPFLFPMACSSPTGAASVQKTKGAVPLVDISAATVPLREFLGPPATSAGPLRDHFADRVAYCERVLRDEKRRLVPPEEPQEESTPTQESAPPPRLQAAATRIQTRWRQYQARRAVRALRRRQAAAALVQKHVRLHQARRRAARRRRELRAAIRIQSLARGIFARTRLPPSALLSKRVSQLAPQALQVASRPPVGPTTMPPQPPAGLPAPQRGPVAAADPEPTPTPEPGHPPAAPPPPAEQRTAAAVRLQAWLRAKHHRFRFECWQRRRASATRIQAVWKGHHVRQLHRTRCLGQAAAQIPQVVQEETP
eukprot:EG_transcript_7565